MADKLTTNAETAQYTGQRQHVAHGQIDAVADNHEGHSHR